MDPDGQPDQGWVYGDVDGDNVLDRNLPGALAQTVLNFTSVPPSSYIAFRVELDEGSLRYTFVPEGSWIIQTIVFALLWVLPIVAALLAIWSYMGAYYKIKFNKIGISKKRFQGVMGIFGKSRGFERLDDQDEMDNRGSGLKPIKLANLHSRNASTTSFAAAVEKGLKKRRCVLIATMEYDIEDWVGNLSGLSLLEHNKLTFHDVGNQNQDWRSRGHGAIDGQVSGRARPRKFQAD